jgi:hypothetical protein
MVRALRVIKFAVAPLRGTGVAHWWPPATAALVAAAAIVGLALTKLTAGLGIALGGAIVILFIAAYRLHSLAFPAFPRHKLDLGRPWVADNPDDNALLGDRKLMIFSVTFYNRELHHRVNLTLDVLWTRVVKKQSLGPYKLSQHTGTLGRLELFPRNADVPPQRHVEGTAAFSAWVPGVELGPQGYEILAPDYLHFHLRLTDHNSGAEHLEPLEVQRPDE